MKRLKDYDWAIDRLITGMESSRVIDYESLGLFEQAFFETLLRGGKRPKIISRAVSSASGK